jgi:hypothetical protein
MARAAISATPLVVISVLRRICVSFRAVGYVFLIAEPFDIQIAGILLVSSQEQMGWIAAQLDIAMMTNEQIAKDLAICLFP